MRDRVVVITGAFGTLGSAIARKYASATTKIIMVDKGAKRPAELTGGVLNDAEVFCKVDLADAEAATDLVHEIRQRHGKIDVLINVAGAFRWESISHGNQDTWDFLYAANVRTTVNMCRAVLPILAHGGDGRIVNIGANAAEKAAAGMGAYAASKSGVHRLTEALAAELKAEVTVNAVLPSIIDTPQNGADMPNANFAAWVQPSVLASIIHFLTSDDGRMISGALIPVVGGM